MNQPHKQPTTSKLRTTIKLLTTFSSYALVLLAGILLGTVSTLDKTSEIEYSPAYRLGQDSTCDSTCYSTYINVNSLNDSTLPEVKRATDGLEDQTHAVVKSKDTSNYSRRFKSFDDLITFVEYVKTQNNTTDMDNWYVIKTILNRLERWDCDWHTYYNLPHTANSNKPLYPQVKVAYPRESYKGSPIDKEILYRVIQAVYMPHSTPSLPQDVLFFHSHTDSQVANLRALHRDFTVGCFNPAKEYVRLRHRFFRE